MTALNAIIFRSILLFPQPSTCVQPGEELIQQYLTMELEGRTVPLLVPRRAKFKGFNPTEHDAYTKRFESEPHESGLDFVVGENAPIDKAIYFLGPNDSPVLVAQCSNRNTRFQLCALFFETHGLEVKLTIDKREFGRWKEIKAGADRFLSCITTL